MRLWVDDVRPAPEGWTWAKSVQEALGIISRVRFELIDIEVISLDHDAGDFVQYGGDYIRILDWLEYKGYNYPIHLHTMNPVGKENMERVIKRFWR